ncbi:uncharacterized protein LOC143041685 [Oratosquilla oratoria]|uniref:uncharacterized protein LOC143041685 n=1 Tax=Oratosquilla oratoria TaxID=337810 RepID=UPI003F76553C
MATTTIAPSDVMSQLDQNLRSYGVDMRELRHYIKYIDIQTLGVFAIMVIICIFIFDSLAYLFAYFKGTTSHYSSYGKSILASSAKVWPEIRNELAVDPYARGRSLDSVTPVLDAIHGAFLRWESAPENNQSLVRAARAKSRAL